MSLLLVLEMKAKSITSDQRTS